MNTRWMVRLVVLAGLIPVLARGATLVWTGDVNNVWNTTDANWLNAGVSSTYTPGDNVVFVDTVVRSNINIAAPITAGLVYFSNTTSRTYLFTNDVVSGTTSLLKTNSGSVFFGSTTAGAPVYGGGMTFSGGTTVRQGMICYVVTTNASTVTNYEAGANLFGFGTGPITLDGDPTGNSATTFRFQLANGLSAVLTLTNDFIIGSRGGKISLERIQPLMSLQNICGNIDMGGNLIITAGNAWTSLSNLSYRVFGGTTTVRTNCTLTLGGDGTGTTRGLFAQNIVDDGTPRTLTFVGYNQGPWAEIAGDNRGVTGGLVVRPHTSSTQPLLFTGTNSLGSGSFLVCTGAYAGLAFDFTPAVIQAMSFEDGAILGLDSNSTAAVNLSASGVNRDIWLGTARGVTYSGTLTPYGSTYKLAGGGSGAMTLPVADTLSGARDVKVGDTNNLLSPGSLVLAASNSFTGGMTLSGSRTANPTVIARAAGALGTGPILFNRTKGSGGTSGIILQFDSSPYSNRVSNDLIFTNTASGSAINAVVPTWLAGNLTFYGTNGMNGGTNTLDFNVSTPASLVVFDQAASGRSVQMATNCRVNVENGTFDPGSAANLPIHAGFRVNGGTLVLSSGFTWSDLVAGRTWVNSSAPIAGQWISRNFAARGTTQVIDATGAFQSGTTNTWVGSGIQLGSAVTNADGSAYANAGVKLARNIEITGDFPITVACQGPGFLGEPGVGYVQEISGTISGTGSVRFVAGSSTNGFVMPELVLSGSSLWTGSVNADFSSNGRIITGPGGMGITQVSPGGFVRFSGNDSIPSMNGGSNCYILALDRTYSTPYYSGYGYLLTGSSSNEVYSLQPGVRFLIGGNNQIGTFGSSGGAATLTNAIISIMKDTNFTSMNMNLLVRGSNAVLNLGSATSPVKFNSCYTTNGNSMGGGWIAPTNATVMYNRFATNTLIKRGVGTLVLSNVVYTLFDGTGDITTNFIWQLGSATVGLNDGVVLECGTNVNDSLRTRDFYIKGAVMGLRSDFTPSFSTFSSPYISMVDSSGGGFAAYGARRVVTITTGGGYNYVQWGQANIADRRCFLKLEAPFYLNAIDADAPIEIASFPTNYIMLSSVNNEVSVYDNPATNSDMGVISARLGGTGGKLLTKSGPGILVLAAVSNDYQCATAVSNGTLVVNGLLTASSSNVLVCGGATLGGTGTVARPVTVQANGYLAGGAGSNSIGTLTISSNVVMSGILSVDLDGSTADRVMVGGSVTFSGTPTIVIANGYDLGGGETRTLLSATGGFSGTLPSTPSRNYTVVQQGNDLLLRRNSPGFIFRIQ